MSRKQSIRLLSIIGILLFFLPFVQTCSDKSIRGSSSYLKAYSSAETDAEKEFAFKKAKQDFTISGVDLAMIFEKEFIGFTIMLFCSITLLVCFFREHYNQMFLCFINLATTFLMILILLMNSMISEIRYGLYLYFFNSTYLFYLVYKEQSEYNFSKRV